jgi:thioredoxin 1
MSTTIVHPNATEFDALLAGDKPVLVDFWAEWCMPCRMLAPVIEQLGEQYAGRVEVAKVDVDKEPELAARYRVQTIPTVLLFNKGQLLETQIGLRPVEEFQRLLDPIL